MNKVIALILALVIANPVCCCAWGCQSGQTEEAPPSCCSGGKTTSEDSEQDGERNPCNCSLGKVKSINDKNIVLPVINVSDLLEGSLASTETELTLPRLSTAVQCISKWPPGSLPIATIHERLARHCSYLL